MPLAPEGWNIEDEVTRRAALRQVYRISTIISWAMVGAVGAYWAVGWYVTAQTAYAPRVAAGVARVLRAVFYGYVVLTPAVVHVVQSVLLNSARGDVRRFVRGLQARSLVTAALAEALAIYGLVLALVTGVLAEFYPFAIASVAFLWLYRPRYDQWDVLVTAQARDQGGVVGGSS